MLKIDIHYNPYYLDTKIKVNKKDILKDSYYSKFKKYINGRLPLQYWINAIDQDDWKGFLEEIVADTAETKLKINFTGRKIDFEDLKRGLDKDNDSRIDDDRLEISYKTNFNISDQMVSEEIEKVIGKMLSPEFSELIKDRKNQILKKNYDNLKEEYSRLKNNEVNIIFIGLYSSGKSTLINSLIGDSVLPISDTTCTTKIYNIKHHKYHISITGFNDNDQIIYLEDNLNNISELKNQISNLINIENDKWSKIKSIEIEMNLSHLYPEGFEDQFKLKLVDTPGTNSGEGNNELQERKHIDITLDTIVNVEKNIVILVVDGQDYHDESIRYLLDSIDHANGLDKGIYNDRFLFVMNKCDNKNYQSDETISKAISEYAKYIQSDGRAKTKHRMISPRIYPTAALPALAIRENCTNESCINSPENENLLHAYQSFSKKCNGSFGADNYHFNKYCPLLTSVEDIGDLVKVDEEFFEILEFSGIPSLEISIKQYIERYAYPMKLRELLETFEGILREIKGLVKADKKLYQDFLDRLKDNKKKRTENEERKKILKEEHDKKEKIKKKLDDLKLKLHKIKYDSRKLDEINAIYNKKINLDPEVISIRKKKYCDTKIEAEECRNKILQKMNDCLGEINRLFEECWKENNEKLNEILIELKLTKEYLEKNGLYSHIKCTISSNKIFKNLSMDSLKKEIKREDRRIDNPIKKVKYKWYQLFDKIEQFFAPKYITREEYRIDFLRDSITHIQYDLEKLCNNHEENFKSILKSYKDMIEEDINDLQKELDANEKDYKKITDFLCKNNPETIEKELLKLESKMNFLDMITEGIIDILMDREEGLNDER